MKKVLGLIVVLAFLGACQLPVKNNFKINGTIDSKASGWVLLQQKLDGPFKTVDSVKLENGKFLFKGSVNYPEVFFIKIPSAKSLIPLFVEPSRIEISINTKNIDRTKITGSLSQAEYDKYLDVIDKFNAQLEENYSFIAKAEEIGDAAKAARFDSVNVEIDNQKSQFIKDYVRNNNKSPITPYLVYRNLYNYDMRELNEVIANMDTTLKASVYMPLLTDYLKTLKRTDIGMLYVSFMMQDSTGIYLPVVDLIGKNYLLLDFWASWCGPCRKENPNLVGVYNDFKDKGFDILGISLDKERTRWLKAIRDDKLPWHHVSDLQYWENRAAKIYGIKSIPSNVLIDPSGIIIAKNLFGDKLRKKLEEIFNKPKV